MNKNADWKPQSEGGRQARREAQELLARTRSGLEAANAKLRAECDARQEAERALQQCRAMLAELSRALQTEIEARTRTEKELSLRQRAVESSVNAIMVTSFGGAGDRIEYVNPAFQLITGYSAPEVLGLHAAFLQGKDRDQPGLEAIRAALREQREGNAVLRNYRKDGSLFWNDLHIAPVRDDAGNVTHFVGVINDITEARSYQKQLERHANHDPLTGLANRNLLRDRLEQAVAQASRRGDIVAVAIIDLDQFKVINDSLGHPAGDEVLRVVAERLRACVRESDTVARLGGDEFVLVLPDLTDSKAVDVVVQRLADSIAAQPRIVEVLQRVLGATAMPVMLAERELDMSCSIGVSMFPHDGTDVDTLLKNADAAMYRAKERGRNNFQFYTGEMNARIGRRLSLQAMLRHALERDEFVLHYQPKLELASGRISGLEALIRWNSPTLGLVPPSDFISVLEDTRMIVDVGWWVVQQAARDYLRWQAAGLSPPRIAVNVSQIQLGLDDFAAVVAAVAGKDARVAGGLDLEITESLIMRDIEANISKIRGIREHGVGIAIDDFGTGYSSLSYLAKLPVDVLKIDRAFIANLATRADDLTIVSTIISLAHSLKLKVVAEGVETEAQAQTLRRLGCDEIQGFLIARPLPAEEYVRWVERFSAAAQAVGS